MQSRPENRVLEPETPTVSHIVNVKPTDTAPRALKSDSLLVRSTYAGHVKVSDT
ncbi:hypothetical protein MASR2M16_16720 [Thauera terpenica]